MMKSKKMILGTLGTMAIVAAPIAAVVSCGSKSSAETEMSALDKALMEVSKPMKLEEYKAFIIKTISENFYKDAQKAPLTKEDFAAVTAAKDAGTAMTEANKMDVFFKAHAAVNTVVSVNGQEIDLGKFVASPTLSVKKAGSAAVEGKAEVTEVLATAATQADINSSIDGAVDVEAIKAILAEYTADNKNETPVDVSSIKGTGSDSAVLTAAKTAAKLLTASLFKKDYVKGTPEVVAKDEVKTIITIDGTDYPLEKFVETPALKVEKAGKAEVTITKTNPQIKAMIADLGAYKTALKEVFKNFKKDDKGASFKDEDLKTITDAKTADAALAAAKAIEVFTA
ncbi:MAG: hypothetical protein GY679_04565 [Mycoplasma sp.]|nr:hypothetical protein [Mycoplasma sp.]